jgi:hypothetical protein
MFKRVVISATSPYYYGGWTIAYAILLASSGFSLSRCIYACALLSLAVYFTQQVGVLSQLPKVLKRQQFYRLYQKYN